jgi:hypothetical protein
MGQAITKQPALFLTVADAARVTKLSPAGFKAAADRGEIPIAARTRRGNRLFRPEDVECFAARRAAQIRAAVAS